MPVLGQKVKAKASKSLICITIEIFLCSASKAFAAFQITVAVGISQCLPKSICQANIVLWHTYKYAYKISELDKKIKIIDSNCY